MFELGSGLIIWEILVFALLIVVLRLYTWKPLISELKKRESIIRQAMENAEQGRKDAEKVLKVAGGALSLSGDETEKVRQRGQELADQIKVAVLAKSAIQAERILNETREEISRFKSLSLQELQTHFGGLVAECAAFLIKSVLDETSHRRLVDKALQSLPHDGSLN